MLLKRKKKWHLADAMTFLDNVVGPTRKMTSSLVITTEPGENDNNSNDVINEELAQQPLIKDDSMEFIPHRKQRKTAAEIVAAPMAEFLKVATEKRKADETEDPMLTFFKSLLPEAKHLSNERKRQFKTSVMATLFQLLDEEELEAVPPSSRPLEVTSGAGTSYNQRGLPIDYGRDRQLYTTTSGDKDKSTMSQTFLTL